MRFKGSGGSGPSNVKSNLYSTDAFEFVLGIAQGPIGGIVGDTTVEKLQHIYLDDTPLFDSFGEPNFDESEILIRLETGTTLTEVESPADGQTPIWYLFGGTTANQNVGSTLNYNVAVSRTTPAIPDGWDQLDVQLSLTSLYRNTDDGTKSHQVEFEIVLSKIGGGHTETKVVTINGKTPQGGFARSVKFELPQRSGATDQYDIQITNLTDDEDEDHVANAVWRGYEVVTRSYSPYSGFAALGVDDPNYEYHPSTAMLHVVGVLGEQLSGIPTVNAEYKGLLCRVPSNYDPVTKTYDETSAWDGNYAVEKFPTDNPFWIVNELILNEEFGVLSYNPNVKINKYSVYDKAKFADGYDPFTDEKNLVNPITNETAVARYTFNGLLSERTGAMDFINKILATTFSVSLENDDGELEILTDMPTVPVAFITAEMALSTGSENPFSYSYTSVHERVNAVSTSFVDKENEYATQYLPEIRNQDAIDRHGLNVAEFTSLGTTTSWEAERKAIIFLTASQTETESVQFILPMSGIQFQVYDVIAVVNAASGHGVSGRIISNTTHSITFRDPIYFAEAESYKLTIQGINQDFEYVFAVGSGYTGVGLTTLGLSTPYPDAAELGDYPVMTITNVEGGTQQVGIPKLYRIASMEPSEDTGVEAFTVSAVEFNSEKHTEADLLNQATQAKYSFQALPTLKRPENFIVVNESIVQTTEGVKVSLWLSWDKQEDRPYATTYEVRVRANGSAAYTLVTTSENYIEVPDLEFAAYDFSLRAKSGDSYSAYAILSYEQGRTAAADLVTASAPATVSGTFENGVLNVTADIWFVAGNGDSTLIPLFASDYLKSAVFGIYDDSDGNDTFLFSVLSYKPDLQLTRSSFLSRLEGEYLPSKLIVRVSFNDHFNVRYPTLAADDFAVTFAPSIEEIANFSITDQTGNVGRYLLTWNDDPNATFEFKLLTSTGDIVLERVLTTSTTKLDTLPVGDYTITIQPRSGSLEYGAVYSTTFSVGSLDTPVGTPTILSENGVIVLTPPLLASRFETYEFWYGKTNVFDNATPYGRGKTLTISNAIAGQVYTLWYRLVTESNANTTIELVNVTGTEQSLFTWEAYGSDDEGSDISLNPDGLTWKGLSAGHTTATPVLTNTTIYSWFPITQGTNWTSSTSVPDDADGLEGYFHLDTSTGDVYLKSNGTWSLDGNLRGGDGDKWLRGTAEPPSNAIGTDGDNYLGTLTYTHYQKASGVWVAIGTIKGDKGDEGDQGPIGPASASSFTLINSANTEVTANTVTRVSGNFSTYDAGAYTQELYDRCIASASLDDTQNDSAFGLSSGSELVTEASLTGIAYALYTSGGDVFVFEGGVSRGVKASGHVSSDILSVINDGQTVRYYKNGQEIYASQVPPAGAYRWDCSIQLNNQVINNVSFLPMGQMGNRGAGVYYAAGGEWLDPTADDAVPEPKQDFDQVTITNGTDFSKTKFWYGGVWVAVTSYIDGNLLVNGIGVFNTIGAGTVDAGFLIVDTVLADAIFSKDITATGTITIGTPNTTQSLVLTSEAGVSPIHIRDADGTSMLSFTNSEDDQGTVTSFLQLGGRLAPSTITSMSVFDANMQAILQPLILGATGGTFATPQRQHDGGVFETDVYPFDTNTSVTKLRLEIANANEQDVTVSFDLTDYYFTSNVDYVASTYTVEIFRSINGGALTSISSVTKIGKLTQSYANIITGELDITIEYTDVSPAMALNDSLLYEAVITFESGTSLNTPTIRDFTISQPVEGGGIAGAATTLAGQAGEYYLDYGNFTNTPNFIRSDIDATVSGHTEWQDGYEVRLGSSADFTMLHNGTNTYLENDTGILHLINKAMNSSTLIQGRTTGGDIYTGVQVVATDTVVVELKYNHNNRLITTSAGVTITGEATATTFIGALSGNAVTASLAEFASKVVNVPFSGAGSYPLAWLSNSRLYTTSTVSITPAEGKITATTFVGDLTGTADTIEMYDTSDNQTVGIAFAINGTVRTSSSLTVNPFNGMVTSVGGFVGPLLGNATSATTAGSVAVVNDDTFVIAPIVYLDGTALKTCTGLTVRASDGLVTSSGGFAGALTGNVIGDVTGDVSGNAGTVTNGVYTNDSRLTDSRNANLAGNLLTSVPTGALFTDTNTWRPIDNTPVNGSTTYGVTSNWAFDHAASSTAHPRDTRNQVAGSYLPLAGGTVTGVVRVNTGGTGGITFRRSTSTEYSGVTFEDENNLPRFLMYMANVVNGDIRLQVRDDSATQVIRGVANIGTSTGVMNFTLTPTVGANAVSLSNHTHSYLPLAGGTLSGPLLVGGQIIASSADLQVNGFMRTGDIYLHQGGTAPTTATAGILSNGGNSLTWNSQTVYHAGNVPMWNQSTTGNASTASLAASLTTSEYSNSGNYNVLVRNGTGVIYSASIFTTPAEGKITATTFVGDLTGTADTVEMYDTSANQTVGLTFAINGTVRTSSSLTVNPFNGMITSIGGFVGPLSGNATSATTAGSVAVVNDDTFVIAPIVYLDGTALKTCTGLTVRASDGLVTSSGGFAGPLLGNVVGNLTGNVTGDVSGNAGTVTNGVYTNDSRLTDSRTPLSHTHSYLPLAGGTLSGNVLINGTGTIGGATHANGWLRFGTTSGLAIDSNEMYWSGTNASFGTLGNYSVFLSANGNLGALTPDGLDVSKRISSSVSTGTAPFIISSITKVINLNADFLDGLSSAEYVQRAGNVPQSINGFKTFENILTVKGGLSAVTFERSVPTDYNGMKWTTAGVQQWLFYQIDNAEGNLSIQARDDIGGIRSVVNFNRLTGQASFSQQVNASTFVGSLVGTASAIANSAYIGSGTFPLAWIGNNDTVYTTPSVYIVPATNTIVADVFHGVAAYVSDGVYKGTDQIFTGVNTFSEDIHISGSKGIVWDDYGTSGYGVPKLWTNTAGKVSLSDANFSAGMGSVNVSIGRDGSEPAYASIAFGANPVTGKNRIIAHPAGGSGIIVCSEQSFIVRTSGGTTSDFVFGADKTLTALAFVGALSGNATTATFASQVVNVPFSGAGSYPLGWLSNDKIYTTTSVFITPATGTITATNFSGNATSVTNGVYTTGNQSIAGIKTFSDWVYSAVNKGFWWNDHVAGFWMTSGDSNTLKVANANLTAGNSSSALAFVGTDGTYTTYGSFTFGTNPTNGYNRIVASPTSSMIACTAVSFIIRSNGGTTNDFIFGADKSLVMTGEITAPVFNGKSTKVQVGSNTSQSNWRSVVWAGLGDDLFASGTGMEYKPSTQELKVGGVVLSSDRRLKDNIQLISDPIGKLSAINGYTYTWKGREDQTRDSHTIAQEVQAVFPEAVVKNEDTGYLSVKVSAEIALLVEVCKAQQATIEHLNNRVAHLELLNIVGK